MTETNLSDLHKRQQTFEEMKKALSKTTREKEQLKAEVRHLSAKIVDLQNELETKKSRFESYVNTGSV